MNFGKNKVIKVIPVIITFDKSLKKEIMHSIVGFSLFKPGAESMIKATIEGIINTPPNLKEKKLPPNK